MRNHDSNSVIHPGPDADQGRIGAESKLAMEQRHLKTFRDVRERLLAQRAEWQRPEHPAGAARTIISQLDEELAVNASLIAAAEEGIARVAQEGVGEGRQAGASVGQGRQEGPPGQYPSVPAAAITCA